MEKKWGGGHILRGRIPGPGDIVLMSNDYLGLANDPRIAKAQIEALEEYGSGMMMSAIFLHGDNPQWRFEAEMAEFMGSESALLCQSGYAANVGLIQSIADEKTPVYIDMLAHRSLLEGIRSAGATPRPFRHNSVEHLARQIRRYGPGVVVVDSVYSTNGSVCPLEELVPYAYEQGCLVVVDESHSLGTHGEQGEGLVASLGLTDKVHFVTASLAKAFCGRAGVIGCSKGFTDYFRFEAPPTIFSSALLPHEVAGLTKTLHITKREGWRRKRLERNARWLREQLIAEGYDLACSQSQIIALEAGDEPATIRLRDALESAGVFGAVFVAPATPEGRGNVRLSLHSLLSQADLDVIADVGARIARIDALPLRSLRCNPGAKKASNY